MRAGVAGQAWQLCEAQAADWDNPAGIWQWLEEESPICEVHMCVCLVACTCVYVCVCVCVCVVAEYARSMTF